jgi:hypothetical protein
LRTHGNPLLCRVALAATERRLVLGIPRCAPACYPGSADGTAHIESGLPVDPETLLRYVEVLTVLKEHGPSPLESLLLECARADARRPGSEFLGVDEDGGWR